MAKRASCKSCFNNSSRPALTLLCIFAAACSDSPREAQGVGVASSTLPNASANSVTIAPSPVASAAEKAVDVAPVLAPEDVGFVDSRGGWGWCDRCFAHMKVRKLAWAKAACNKAMEMNPASPQPRASILFNLGLVAELEGSKDSARSFYTQSLKLRQHPAVQAALDGLDTAAPGASGSIDPGADPFTKALSVCNDAREKVNEGRRAFELAKQSRDVEGMKESSGQIQAAMPAWRSASKEASRLVLPASSGSDVVERNKRLKQLCALD